MKFTIYDKTTLKPIKTVTHCSDLLEYNNIDLYWIEGSVLYHSVHFYITFVLGKKFHCDYRLKN